MELRKLAEDIVRNVGGKENISSLEHCVTRLRFVLKDNSAANTDTIKQMNGVMTVVISGGQYQVVIGNKVKDVFREVMDVLGASFASGKEQENGGAAADAKKKSAFNRFVDIIVGTISPLLGLLAASGIIKGLLGLASALHWLEPTDGTYLLLNALGDSLFYFLPIIVGFSAGRKFNGNPFIPAVIGAALVYPAIVEAVNQGQSLTFAGIPIVLQKYASSLFPVMMAAWLAAKVEKWLERKLHAAIKLIFVPLITLVVVGTLTFLAVGPVLSIFSQGLADATMWIYNLSPVIAGVILGALWQLIVIFGLHYAFIPVLINNITTLHFDPVNAILNVTVWAQVGAALGVFLKAKNQKVRSIAGPAAFSAFLGVTEPAIYGVSLPYKKPFVMAGIGGGIAGGIAAAMGTKMYGFGGTGIFASPLFINPEGLDTGFYGFVISSLTAMVLATILTYLFAYKDKPDTAADAPNSTPSNANHQITTAIPGNTVKEVYNPLQGTIIPLSEVNDEAFASGAMGSGYAVIPHDNKVYAPFDGTVLTVVHSKHAIALVSDSGVELLIHMGINTVKLKGAPFEIKVQENGVVKKGQLLAIVDWELIERENYATMTPVIVTNAAEQRSVELKAEQHKTANAGDLVLRID